MTVPTDRGHAATLDSNDGLSRFRSRFWLPPDRVYFDGNSLGLLSRDGEECLQRVVEEWKTRAIGGWTDVEVPWFDMAERLGGALAPLIGAKPHEVIVTGGTTLNLHAIVSTLYDGSGRRTKLLADSLTFPSDIYALQSQVRLRGRGDSDLVLVAGDGERFLDEDEIIDAMTEDVAIAILPSVLYRSGQLLDMARIAAAARKRGVLVGFDCSHSIGVVPHAMNEWDIDFAFGCAYKYLNGGPGCPAFLYLNERHFDREPAIAGWFGYRKDRQFDLATTFEHARHAGGWQISSPGVLGMAPIEGALRIVDEAGIPAVREKSVRMTSYFIELVDVLLPEAETGISVGSPRDPARRGGHLALEHDDAPRIYETLLAGGVVGDLRPPNIIRLAPAPLYNAFTEIWDVVDRLRSITHGH